MLVSVKKDNKGYLLYNRDTSFVYLCFKFSKVGYVITISLIYIKIGERREWKLGVIEISVALIAIAFAFLVFFVVRTLLTVQSSLVQLNQTMIHTQQQLDDVSKETTELLRNTNQITQDIQQKSQSLDSLFSSVNDVGLAVQQVSSSFKQVSTTLSESVERTVVKSTEQNQDKVAEMIRYTTIGLNLWRKWQERKEKKLHKQE